MAQGGWGQGPIDIGRGFTIHLPSFLQSRARMVRLVVIAMAVLVLLLTGYYQVEPDEVGVVLRFGKFVGTTDPGPHFKLPFGIETRDKVPVQRQLKTEFGFRTVRPGRRSTEFAAHARDRAREVARCSPATSTSRWSSGSSSTGSRTRRSTCSTCATCETFRDMSEAAMRQVVGRPQRQRGAHHRPRGDRHCRPRTQLQRLCDRYDTASTSSSSCSRT